MRSNLKIFGAEVLYLLASTIVAGLAALLQTVGRSHEGDYSSFIWSGSEYRYNPFFYMFGLALFVGFMIVGYNFFLKKRMLYLNQKGIIPKIVFLGVAVSFSLLMLATIVFGLFLVTGLTDNMRPDWMLNLTGFGWPVFCLVFMIIAEVSVARKNDVTEEENRYVADIENDRMEIRPVKISSVGAGDAIVFIMLVIFSVAGFTGRNVILGYLAGVLAVLLFPYLTLKRPFFKADVYGILYRKPTSFGYGKAEFIPWEQVEAIIEGDWIFSIDENLGVISEKQLNAQALSGLSAFAGYTEAECEDQAEWIENGFFIVIKPMEEEKIELLDLGTFFRQKDFLKKTEMLRILWAYHFKLGALDDEVPEGDK